MAITLEGNGLITAGGTSTTQGRVRLAEDTDNGTNYIELTAPASVTSNRTVTFPDETGTIITTASTFGATGPAFSAYRATSAQTVTNATLTKLQAQTEEFDTASCYDNATNYRFTPNVAGYYQVNGSIYLQATTALADVNFITIYKNGSRFKDGTAFYGGGAVGKYVFAQVSTIIYLNGSTDYIELYGYVNGTGTLTFESSTGAWSYFQAFLARAA